MKILTKDALRFAAMSGFAALFFLGVAQAGPITYITLKAPGATATYAQGINNLGQVVGYYTDATGVHGFVKSGGGYLTLNAPGASATYAQGINDAGQVVGYYSDATGDHGFVESGGLYTTLNDPLNDPGPVSTYAFGINNAGQVAGLRL